MFSSVCRRFLAVSLALPLVLPLSAVVTVAEHAHADYTDCSDGIDNDGDRRIDYPEDPECSSINDTTEDYNPGIFVTVTDNRDQINPSGALTYVITLKQQRDPVALVDVSFHVPAQHSIVSTSDDGSIVPGTVHWTKVAVFKDNVRRLQVHVAVSPHAGRGQLIVAQVSAGNNQSTDTTMINPQNVLPYPQNQLQVTVSDHRDNALGGDILDYVITVKNPEPNPATFHVQATIPPALQMMDAQGADRMGDRLVWQNITLNPGQERAFVFRASVHNQVPNRYPIQVVARAGNVVATDRTIVGSGGAGPYSLFGTITDNRDVAERGDLLTYRIHVDNTSGRLETGANIDAAIPNYVEFVSATEGGTLDNRNVRWLRTIVAPGSSRDLSFTVRVRTDAPDRALLRATATIQGATASDITEVGGGQYSYGSYISSSRGTGYGTPGSLSVRKTSDNRAAYPGSTVSYTLTVRNADGGELRNVAVTDNFNPSDFVVTDAGAGNVEQGRIAWNIDTLRPGETRSFRYTGRIARVGGDSLVNTAQAYTADLDYAAMAGSNVAVYDGYHGDYLMPQTGAGDFFGPIENTAQFLTPVSAATEGNALPLLLWIALIVGGVAVGGVASKKFIV